jgi:hypothetical protein
MSFSPWEWPNHPRGPRGWPNHPRLKPIIFIFILFAMEWSNQPISHPRFASAIPIAKMEVAGQPHGGTPLLFSLLKKNTNNN